MLVVPVNPVQPQCKRYVEFASHLVKAVDISLSDAAAIQTMPASAWLVFTQDPVASESQPHIQLLVPVESWVM